QQSFPPCRSYDPAALLGGGQDVAFVPDLRVVHVAGIGGDVEVAQHHHFREALQFGGEPVVHRVQPAQLVGELLTAHRLPIHHVEVDDADPVDRGGDHPLLVVLEAGDAHLYVQRGQPAEDRNPVVGLLATEHAAVSGGGEFGVGKAVVRQLGFLQPDHVGAGGFKPLQQVRQADVEGVDVPAGDFHGRQSSPPPQSSEAGSLLSSRSSSCSRVPWSLTTRRNHTCSGISPQCAALSAR